MSKKAIVLGVLMLAVLSLSSCRSKKNSCTKVDTQEQIQNQDVACDTPTNYVEVRN